MSDAFLILAQAPGGLSCFFLPRFTPDGAVNAIRIERLKDKLGDRSNASSEVEFCGARAWLVGDEGRGVPIILEMGTYCRLDCVLGTAGLIRAVRVAGPAPREVPGRVRQGADRTAADAPRPRRSRDRVGGGDRAGDAPRGGVRCAVARAVVAAASPADAGGEVLDLQARSGRRGGSDGSAGRQRLRRGRPAGASVSADAPQLDLGGLGQRHVSRRAAGHCEAPELHRRARRGSGSGAWA